MVALTVGQVVGSLGFVLDCYGGCLFDSGSLATIFQIQITVDY